MAIYPVISALKRKRAVVSGEPRAAERRRAAMQEHLAVLDATLRLMCYEGDPPDIKPVAPRKRRLFPRRGELQRAVLDILHTAKGPMSDGDVADRVMAAKGMDVGNPDLRGTVMEMVSVVRKRPAP